MSSTIDLNLMEASIRGDSGQYSYPKFVQDQLQQNPHLNQNDAAKLWENTIQKVLLSKGTSYEKISDTQYKVHGVHLLNSHICFESMRSHLSSTHAPLWQVIGRW